MLNIIFNFIHLIHFLPIVDPPKPYTLDIYNSLVRRFKFKEVLWILGAQSKVPIVLDILMWVLLSVSGRFTAMMAHYINTGHGHPFLNPQLSCNMDKANNLKYRYHPKNNLQNNSDQFLSCHVG